MTELDRSAPSGQLASYRERGEREEGRKRTHPVTIAHPKPHHAASPPLAGNIFHIDDTANAVVERCLGRELQDQGRARGLVDSLQHAQLDIGQLWSEHLVHGLLPQEGLSSAVSACSKQRLQNFGVISGRRPQSSTAALDGRVARDGQWAIREPPGICVAE